VLDQLLWLDVLVKAVGGVLLLVIPRVTIAALGLPRSDQAFYPRLLGVLLLAIALAIFADAADWTGDGLGASGAALINIAGGVLIYTLVLVPRPFLSTRGRILLWATGGLLLLLGLAELLSR